jgi:hypothetical protein
MKFMKLIGKFIRKAWPANSAEMRSIVIMQREAHQFSGDELRTAGERGWGTKFDGKEDPMYFVSATYPPLVIVKAGPHMIRVSSVSTRYVEDDEYALSQLPRPEQKKAWKEHHAYTLLELFNDIKDRDIPDKEAYSSLARLALQLGDPNCSAIFVPIKNIMMPNDGAAEQGLRFLIKKELPG